nr:HlyD family efflux transporter periplasmic adaptor subunit [Angustibacter aerolatus]
MEVSADVAEADIGDVTKGETAVVTLSASGETATAKVTSVALEGTTSDNVVQYPVTVQARRGAGRRAARRERRRGHHHRQRRGRADRADRRREHHGHPLVRHRRERDDAHPGAGDEGPTGHQHHRGLGRRPEGG